MFSFWKKDRSKKSQFPRYLSVFQNIEDNSIKVQEGAKHPKFGYGIGQGRIHQYTFVELQENASKILLQHLSNYGFDGPKQPSELQTWEQAEVKKFYRDHKSVGLCETQLGEFQFSPMHRKRNNRSSAVGYLEDTIVVSVASTNQELLETIQKAFEKAT